MTRYGIASRVRVRGNDQETPLGLWGKAGLVVGIDAPPLPGGEFTHRPLQIYAVMFDGDNAPISVFEPWLESA